MKRGLGRAYQRFRGNHPRRPASRSSRAMEIVCDGLLASAVMAFVGGLGLTVWSLFRGIEAIPLVSGLALLALSPALLFLWERLAWEPFMKGFSQL